MKYFLLTLIPILSLTTYSQAAQPSIRLEIGQSHTWQVAAKHKYNASRVQLLAGAHYEFHVSGAWTDAKIRCNANGWTEKSVRPILRPLIRAAEKKRRCRCANWFELIGTVGCNECHQFRIGCRGSGWTYTPRCDGMLYAFANDLHSRYGNNSGCLRVTVMRVAKPGRQLPLCGK